MAKRDPDETPAGIGQLHGGPWDTPPGQSHREMIVPPWPPRRPAHCVPGVSSLLLGIIALALFVTGPFALVLGIQDLVAHRRRNLPADMSAVAGATLGALTSAILAISVIIALAR